MKSSFSPDNLLAEKSAKLKELAALTGQEFYALPNFPISDEQLYDILAISAGQIDGILRMIEEDRYCMDISNQIMATGSVLARANKEVLRGHMAHFASRSTFAETPSSAFSAFSTRALQCPQDMPSIIIFFRCSPAPTKRCCAGIWRAVYGRRLKQAARMKRSKSCLSC